VARTQVSQEHSHIGPRDVAPFATFDAKDYQELSRLGINIPSSELRDMMRALVPTEGTGMDALTPGITTPSITTPVQFLQAWLPGFVEIMTRARKIDELVGISTIGQWEDEEIIQPLLEILGGATPYGDYTNVPFTDWNVNFEQRSIIRFEQGMEVGKLEDARAARIRMNTAAAKREGAARGLEIERNNVGFFGYNGGANLTYGFLNDPGLPAYVTLPNGANSSPLWSSKTYLEITADIRTAIIALRYSMGDNFDPKTSEMTLAIASTVVDFLSVTSEYGNSVNNWITENYPKLRVVSAPELTAANGGASVFYLYVESFKDQSTDDGRTFIQPVPTKFMTIGVQQRIKSYAEDYGNALSGVWCKRPFAVVRYSGC
jgi:hypothetical protein